MAKTRYTLLYRIYMLVCLCCTVRSDIIIIIIIIIIALQVET